MLRNNYFSFPQPEIKYVLVIGIATDKLDPLYKGRIEFSLGIAEKSFDMLIVFKICKMLFISRYFQ